MENIPYADSVCSGPGTVSRRPLLMIEPPYKTMQTKHDTETDAKVGPTVQDSNVRETPANSKSDDKAVTSNSDVNGVSWHP